MKKVKFVRFYKRDALKLLNFYEKYVNLCASANKAPSKVAEEMGFTRAAVSSWKSGKAKPSDITMAKIAEYFDVPVDYLKNDSEEERKKDPALDVKTDTENKVSDLDLFTLNILHRLTPENQEKAIAHLLELAAKSAKNE